jgi:hypothetical protein
MRPAIAFGNGLVYVTARPEGNNGNSGGSRLARGGGVCPKAKWPRQAIPHRVVLMAESDKTKLLLESLRIEPCAVCIEKVGTVNSDSDERCALCGMSFKQRLALCSPKR